MLHIDIDQDEDRWAEMGVDLADCIEHSLRAAVAATDFKPCLEDETICEMSLLLSSDAHVQALNNAYRGKDKPTNVLSFPGGDEDQPKVDGFPTHFGDIIIAYDIVMREADAQKKNPQDHLLHLCVHGCLHLLGYDHIRDEDAQIMENLERQILKTMGISDPYLDTKQVEHS